MPIYEYFCTPCSHRFDQLVGLNDSEAGRCPQCGDTQTRRLISRFAVGGQGDLRESTLHGCHDCEVPLRDNGTSASSTGESAGAEPSGGHSCGTGCSH